MSAAEESTTREAAVLFEREPNGRLIRRLLATLDAARSRPATDPVLERVIDRREDADAAHEIVSRSRPATDPAGLDAETVRALREAIIREVHAYDLNGTSTLGIATGVDRAFASVGARLSVADGPGPEERP